MAFNLQEQLGYNIHRVAILVRRELTRCLREYKITPEQWQVLATLWKHGVLNQTEISTVTLLDPPAVSRMIKRMTENGLVIKKRSEESERVTLIILTKKGKQLETVLPDKLRLHFADLWEKFPEKKRTMLRDLLLEFRMAYGDLQS